MAKVEPPSPTRAELARELLRYKMEEYSQDGFCASWLIDLEFELWNAADEPETADRMADTVRVSRECRILAEIAGGWWFWDPDAPVDGNPVFVSLDRWQQILARHASAE